MQLINELRKEFKAYAVEGMPKSAMTFCIDVYCDRLVVVNPSFWVGEFFSRRGVVADEDRGGWAISLEDAKKLGFDKQGNTFRIQYADLRKNAFV